MLSISQFFGKCHKKFYKINLLYYRYPKSLLNFHPQNKALSWVSAPDRPGGSGQEHPRRISALWQCDRCGMPSHPPAY